MRRRYVRAVIVRLNGLLVTRAAERGRVGVEVSLDGEGLQERGKERGQEDRDPRASRARAGKAAPAYPHHRRADVTL